MKMLKSLLVLSLLISGSVSMAKSPHDSDSSHVDIEIVQGKIIAAEYNMLNREISRLEKKLSDVLSELPAHLERNEGKIVALITNQVEKDLSELKKEIEELEYNKSSDAIYDKLKEIEKDIEMI